MHLRTGWINTGEIFIMILNHKWLHNQGQGRDTEDRWCASDGLRVGMTKVGGHHHLSRVIKDDKSWGLVYTSAGSWPTLTNSGGPHSPKEPIWMYGVYTLFYMNVLIMNISLYGCLD